MSKSTSSASGADRLANPSRTSERPSEPRAPDPFNPASLRSGGNPFGEMASRAVLATVRCRRPTKTEWFQVRAGDEWQLQTNVLVMERGFDKEVYLVAPELWVDLESELTPALLLACINRSGGPFVWWIRLPGPDGRINSWTQSALAIAHAAESNWCRMVADKASGQYQLLQPEALLPPALWPDMPFARLLGLAFKHRQIDSLDHAVLRELRGAS
jgi:hypothetical protein